MDVADAEDQRVNTISRGDKSNIPKLVRAMQLNIRCMKDERLAKSIDRHKRTQEKGNGELT